MCIFLINSSRFPMQEISSLVISNLCSTFPQRFAAVRRASFITRLTRRSCVSVYHRQIGISSSKINFLARRKFSDRQKICFGGVAIAPVSPVAMTLSGCCCWWWWWCVCVLQHLESDIDSKTAELTAVSSQCESLASESMASCPGLTELQSTVDQLKSRFDQLRAKANQRRQLWVVWPTYFHI